MSGESKKTWSKRKLVLGQHKIEQNENNRMDSDQYKHFERIQTHLSSVNKIQLLYMYNMKNLM